MSTWLDHETPRYLTEHYFWMYLWGCFWVKLVLNQWPHKAIYLLNMGKHHSIQAEKAEEGTILFLPDCLRCNIDLLPLALLVVRLSHPDWSPHCEHPLFSGHRMWSEFHHWLYCHSIYSMALFLWRTLIHPNLSINIYKSFRFSIKLLRNFIGYKNTVFSDNHLSAS